MPPFIDWDLAIQTNSTHPKYIEHDTDLTWWNKAMDRTI
jgi:hypothetical protein